MDTRDLIELGDIDELIRQIDRLCSSSSWDELLFLRDGCRKALDRGKQLWSAASHAEYRLALEAPGEYVAAVLVPGAGQFAPGPLAEVAASSHLYGEVSPHLDSSPIAAFFAHECVVQGEDLREAPNVDASVLELPLVTQTWEPHFPVAKYESDGAHFPGPLVPESSSISLPPPTRYKVIADAETANAAQDLVSAWTRESNGNCDTTVVEGGPADAIAALGLKKAGIVPIVLDEAIAHLSWAGGSGGAHGGRRGMAVGRFSTWWLLSALTQTLDQWPVHGSELGKRAESLHYWLFTTNEPATGWNLRLAIHDPSRDVAWAISASDTYSL